MGAACAARLYGVGPAHVREADARREPLEGLGAVAERAELGNDAAGRHEEDVGVARAVHACEDGGGAEEGELLGEGHAVELGR
eukprot:4952195-Prymnesium_polylepis.1